MHRGDNKIFKSIVNNLFETPEEDTQEMQKEKSNDSRVKVESKLSSNFSGKTKSTSIKRVDSNRKQYSLSELFNVCSFKIDKTIGINELSANLDIEPETIMKINDLKGNVESYVFQSGEQVLLPLKANQQYLSQMEQQDLTLSDISKFNLEKKLGDTQRNKNFFCYYVTTKGDIFGKLMIYDDFLEFKPIALKYAGLFSFSENESLEHNKKMQLKIDYRDLVCEPMKIPIPSEVDGGFYMSWYIQFELYNTGYDENYTDETKKLISKFREQKKGLCTLAFKIPGKDLQKNDRDDLQKMELSDKIIQFIETKKKNFLENKQYDQLDNETTVPYYNICYNSLFENPHDIDHINSNFSLIHDIFGINKKTTSCLQINNQSLYPLNFEFPSIDKNKVKIDKSENWYHNVDMQNVKKLEFVMVDTSDIIPQILAKNIRKHLPKLYQNNPWLLQYSRLRDGMSYNTLYRQCNNKGPVMILIRDTKGATFGGFYSESLNKAKDKYVGTGESFLFKINSKNELIKYEYSFQNNYFLMCDNDGIQMGADPYAGLHISPDLKQGYSHECKTYDNQILASSKKFKIYKLEIWGFDYDDFCWW